MKITPEGKIIASLLPPEDAKQVLLALFSEKDDLPELTPLANMAYTVIIGCDRIIKFKPGKAGGVPVVRDTITDSGDGSHVDRFDDFWKAYPRKVGKEAARKVWRRLKPTASLHAKILSSIEKTKNSGQWRQDNGMYIPNPATWLNQGRWDDEMQPIPRSLSKNIRNMGGYIQREYDEDYLNQFITNEFGKTL